MITKKLQAILKGKNRLMLDEYAQNMQYPLTTKKLKNLISIVKKRESLYLLSKFANEKAREEYVQNVYQDLEQTIQVKKGLKLLNNRYKDELAGGWSVKEELAPARLTLFKLREFLLYLLLSNENAPLKLMESVLGDNPDWFWFETSSSPSFSREIAQQLSELLGKYDWNENDIPEYDSRFSKLKKKIPAGWDWKKYLAHFYKIHLMPKPENVHRVLSVLFRLFGETDISKYTDSFKIDLSFASGLDGNVHSPVIVIYVLPTEDENDYKSNAQRIINLLVRDTKQAWGSDLSPRFNYKINDLIFVAQGEGSDKFLYQSNLQAVFQAPEFAFYLPEWVGDSTADFRLKNIKE